MSESVADLANLDGGFLGSSRHGAEWARRGVLAKLRRLKLGGLRWVEGAEECFFGDPGAELQATVVVRDPRLYARLALGGSIGAGEAYMAGHFTTNDLTTLVRLLVRNRSLLEGLEGGWVRFRAPLRRFFHFLRRNTPGGSRRNIAAHYDLSNELFALFLDPEMMYSSAIFEPPGCTLEEASRVKLERICRKLELRPEDHVLEIGTGWGGFAAYAASHYGCRVTTTTVSPAQLECARARIAAAGLAERVEVVGEDYRELRGRYDKLVSIEMVEAVGRRFLRGFFRRCDELLAPDGRMLLQAITLADRHYEAAQGRVDFIQRYIFPGSHIPSVSSLTAAIAESELTVTHLEDIGPHYAETLRCWRQRFFERLGEVRQQGFSERFIRMWEFYLCYCEGGFRERSISDVQLLLVKPDFRGPSLLGELGAVSTTPGGEA